MLGVVEVEEGSVFDMLQPPWGIEAMTLLELWHIPPDSYTMLFKDARPFPVEPEPHNFHPQAAPGRQGRRCTARLSAGNPC